MAALQARDASHDLIGQVVGAATDGGRVQDPQLAGALEVLRLKLQSAGPAPPQAPAERAVPPRAPWADADAIDSDEDVQEWFDLLEREDPYRNILN